MVAITQEGPRILLFAWNPDQVLSTRRIAPKRGMREARGSTRRTNTAQQMSLAQQPVGLVSFCFIFSIFSVYSFFIGAPLLGFSLALLGRASKTRTPRRCNPFRHRRDHHRIAVTSSFTAPSPHFHHPQLFSRPPAPLSGRGCRLQTSQAVPYVDITLHRVPGGVE